MRFRHFSQALLALTISALLSLVAVATALADPIPPHWP
jgi:hypothetical protein